MMAAARAETVVGMTSVKPMEVTRRLSWIVTMERVFEW